MGSVAFLITLIAHYLREKVKEVSMKNKSNISKTTKLSKTVVSFGLEIVYATGANMVAMMVTSLIHFKNSA